MYKNGIKIGYLPLYIKLYDDSNPHYRDPMVKHMQAMMDMLETEGFEIVTAPIHTVGDYDTELLGNNVCRVKPEFEEAVAQLNAADVDAVITQHLAYSPSLESIDALCKLNAPIIVLDTTPDFSLIEQAGYYNGISHNHGIHGVQDMCNLLKQRGVNYEIVAGHALHSDVVAQAGRLAKAAKAAKNFKNARVGTVGGSFTGMGDFFVSPEHYEASIGAKVSLMDQAAVKEAVAAVTDAEIDAEIEIEKKLFTYEIKDEEAYRLAVKSGLAVRKWAEKEQLDSCTVNFLTLDECGLPKMPFTECTKMLMRGMGYAGEGDVLTAGLVGALRRVYPNTTFTEMFCPDWKEDVILLSHMGECNANLAKWRPVLRTVPFNYNTCGDTAAAYTCLRAGKATFVNLAPMNDGYNMIVTAVDMLDAGLEFGVYRASTQGWMKPCKPLNEFLPEFSMAGGTHHSALVYDVAVEDIAAFGRMMGFNVIIIK